METGQTLQQRRSTPTYQDVYSQTPVPQTTSSTHLLSLNLTLFSFWIQSVVFSFYCTVHLKVLLLNSGTFFMISMILLYL